MILPMTRDIQDFTAVAAEPPAGEAERLSPREEPATAPADAGEGAAASFVSRAAAAPASEGQAGPGRTPSLI